MPSSRDELTVKVSGEAGQGMQTVGAALCRIFKKRGFCIFADQDYMSRIRGGNNFFRLRIAGRPLYTLRDKSDIAVALDDPGIAKIAEGAGDTKGVNSVACGLIVGLTGIEFVHVEEELRAAFEKKGEEIVAANIRAAKAGYDHAVAGPQKQDFIINPASSAKPLLMNGNDAIAMGAIRAGCKFYSAYPMTPSTSIMNVIAHYSKEYGILVEQAEDEIAAINMAIGASFAGARAMASTSGGGFALMVEGVSLSGMTETPVVIVDAQRPAPATGFPTRTEQADLDFILHAGHGEFARAVFAPGTIEEAFYLTVRAFNLAEKYQIPVFILTDQHLADSYRDVDNVDLNKAKVVRYVISRAESGKVKGYKRYRLTDSGISPRAIPSWIDDVIYVDSDEHTEEGHITEDAGIRVKMVEKRLYKKMAGLSAEIEKPSAHNLDDAELVLVGFGSTYGVMKEASGRTGGRKAGFIHLSQVWPFPSKEITVLLKGKRAVTVENNATGQLARLIRRETGIELGRPILKYDGRPFDLDYLTEKIKEV